MKTSHLIMNEEMSLSGPVRSDQVRSVAVVSSGQVR